MAVKGTRQERGSVLYFRVHRRGVLTPWGSSHHRPHLCTVGVVNALI